MIVGWVPRRREGRIPDARIEFSVLRKVQLHLVILAEQRTGVARLQIERDRPISPTSSWRTTKSEKIQPLRSLRAVAKRQETRGPYPVMFLKCRPLLGRLAALPPNMRTCRRFTLVRAVAHRTDNLAQTPRRSPLEILHTVSPARIIVHRSADCARVRRYERGAHP